MDETGAYDAFREGQAQLAAGEWLRAIPLLERARALEPDKGSIREALAVAYLRARRFRDAEVEARAATDFAPNDHYAYFLLGRAQQGLGLVALARGSYKLATWLRPEAEEYRVALRRLPAA